MKIDTLELLTLDLDGLADFYGAVLGLPLAKRGETSLVVQAGYSRLVWTPAPAGWQGAYHFAFNIPQNQLAAAKAWLSARAPLIRSSAGEDEFDFSHWNARAVYCYDPAGNIVELIARYAMNNSADGAFDGGRLLGISEIGLTTPAVPETVKQIRQAMGLDVFRGSFGESFAALGDDDGLFIIVHEGRLWFPDTGVPARLLPLAVTVSTGQGHRFTLSGPPYRVSETAPGEAGLARLG